MSLNLRFNHLLMSCLALAIIGYFFQAFFTYTSFQSVDRNYKAVLEAKTFQQEFEALETHMLELERKFQYLTPESVIDMKQTTAEFNDQINDISTHYPNASDTIKNILSSLRSYNDSLISRLSVSELIGFPEQEESLLAQVNASLEELKDNRKNNFLVLMKDEQQALLNAQANYMVSPTENNSQVLADALLKFEGKIESYRMTDRTADVVKPFVELSTALTNAYKELNNHKQSSNNYYSQLSSLFAQLDIETTDNITRIQNISKQQTQKNFTMFITITVVVVSLVSLIMWWVIRHVTKSLNVAQRELAMVEKGDLSRRLTFNAKRNDAIDQLTRSINDMAKHLSQVIGQVKGSSNDLNDTVKDINTMVTEVSESNHSVILKTNSLATATEEISMTMQDISKNIHTVNDISSEAAIETKQGSELVTSVAGLVKVALDAMNNIKTSISELTQKSKEIDSVIEMINNLANQTNLLALNAAIEAARAGEAGRGFSVVADEVRSLAESTVSATSKITDTIRAFQQETMVTSEAVSQGEKSLIDMHEGSSQALEGIGKIDAIVGRNADATMQISVAITEIAQTISTMSKDTEEIASSLVKDGDSFKQLVQYSGTIADKSDSLQGIANRFKT